MSDILEVCLGVAVLTVGLWVVIAIIQGILKCLWYYFKWRVLGWRPDIYDGEIVEEISESCAKGVMSYQLDEMRKEGIDLPTEEEIREHKASVKQLARDIIDQYVKVFSMYGKPGRRNQHAC